MRKIKSITTVLTPPQSDGEASAIIREAIAKNMQADAIEAERQKELERINKHYDRLARPLIVEGLTLSTFVFNYVEENRGRLIKSARSKTVKFHHGRVKWKFNRPSLRIINQAVAVRRLLKRKLNHLIKTEHTVRKEPTKNYLRNGGKRIPGLKVVREEELTLSARNGKFKIKRSDLPKLRLKTPPE